MTADDMRQDKRVVPPLCGECDERWIETPAGLAKCPRCYPQEVAS